MNRDDIVTMAKKVGNLAVVVALVLGGYKTGSSSAAEVQSAEAAATTTATTATTSAAALAVRAEIQPLRADVQRLAAAVDVLWANKHDIEQRVAQLELPASATAADDWRQLPVAVSRGRVRR